MRKSNDNEVVLWYVANGIDAMRNCLIFHNKKADDFDVSMFSELNMRMRKSSKAKGIAYHEHDLFRWVKNQWVFSGSGWLAHIQANIKAIVSIPEMSELYNSYSVMRRSWNEIRRIEAREDEYSELTNDEVQEAVKQEWIQATMSFDAPRVVTRG